MTKNLLINEVFGRTIQGEGPATGQSCVFVRLAICPLHCKWCDTAYTWAYTPALAAKHQSGKMYSKLEEVQEISPKDVANHVRDIAGPSRLVVISGGEPLAQIPPRLQHPEGELIPQLNEDDPVGSLAYWLYNYGFSVHIETAGIKFPSELLRAYVSNFVVSPKLATSGNSEISRRKLDVLRWFARFEGADFKFVITELSDINEVAYLEKACCIQSDKIWLMPQGTTADELAQSRNQVAELALQRGYNYSDRLHILLWGTERGH